MSLINFKDIHSGKRVFIVGNGPSLSNTNLNQIVDEYSFGMNRVSKIYNRTIWRPNYFICTTTNIRDSDWRKDIMKTVDLGVTSFVWDNISTFFRDKKSVHFLNCLNGKEVSDSAPLCWWSDRIDSHVTKFGTSMIVAFQIAVFMGFSEIFIVGADLGFKDSFLQNFFYSLNLKKIGHIFDSNHFGSGYGTPGYKARILNKNMLAAHRLIKKSCENRGVKVFNATKGGALEIYERVDFDNIFD